MRYYLMGLGVVLAFVAAMVGGIGLGFVLITKFPLLLTCMDWAVSVTCAIAVPGVLLWLAHIIGQAIRSDLECGMERNFTLLGRKFSPKVRDER